VRRAFPGLTIGAVGHGPECQLENVFEIRVDPTSIFTEKNPISTAWKAQSAENAREAIHTSVRVL